MTVGEALDGVKLAAELPGGLVSTEVGGLEYDSRRVMPGGLFFAFLGQRFDGRQFAAQALERGAIAVVCETGPPAGFTGPWIQVEHGRKALARASRNLYAGAMSGIAVTGITGTNGKTTTAYLADSIARAAGRTTAMIGTVEYQLAGKPQDAINTTPESLDLYRIFNELAHLGGTHATMEVSSHALAQGRVYGLPFHTAVFTNLTRDHLDYHGTIDEYFEAKRLLFEDPAAPPRVAVLNRDDKWAGRIRPANGETIWYGLNAGADLRASDIRAGFDGLRFQVHWKDERREVRSALLGRMNVYNVLAAIGAGLTYGFSWEAIQRGVANCQAVPGRFERIVEGQPFLVVVDYAHTDDALRNVIAAARGLKPNRVITVFGCGGDRDRAKRPLMGQAVGEGSDYVVLTSDNPRSEDPVAIMNDALVGLRRLDVAHRAEPDREKAIRLALGEAGAGDVVLIAGKGHETSQILKDGAIAFDDREVARRLLREFGYRRGEQ